MSVIDDIRRRARRRPRLKVVGGAPRPRHEGCWSFGGPVDKRYLRLEVWTPAEWEALPDHERPGNAGRVRGIGCVAIEFVTKEQYDEIAAAEAALAEWGL